MDLTYPQAIALGCACLGAGIGFAGFMLAHGVAEIGEGLKRLGLAIEQYGRLQRPPRED